MILNILSRLILAHIIADFPLQFDFIFKMKTKGFFGIIPHSLIHVILIYLFFPSFHTYRHFYLYLFLILFLHTLQDNTKFLIWNKTKIDNLFLFLLDQFVHFLVMFTIFIFPFSRYFNPSDPILLSDTKLNLFFSFLIFISFGGTILIYYIEKIYRKGVQISSFERKFGVIERIILFSLISRDLRFLLLAPCFYGLRVLVQKENSPSKILSIFLSSVSGIIFNLL